MFEFLRINQLYVVLGVVLLVWAGVLWFLFRLDGKVKQLEEAMKKGK